MVGPHASSSGTIGFIYVKAKLTFFVTLLFTHPRLSVRLPLFSPRTYIRGPAANQRAKYSDRRGVRGGAQLGARAADAGGSDAVTWLVFFFDPSSFFLSFASRRCWATPHSRKGTSGFLCAVGPRSGGTVGDGEGVHLLWAKVARVLYV